MYHLTSGVGAAFSVAVHVTSAAMTVNSMVVARVTLGALQACCPAQDLTRRFLQVSVKQGHSGDRPREPSLKT